ncbi:MAG TPA: hypothetical protein VNO70_02900 [Blastocatellia bacterium]|nr:hypothetical protein [Blastocatellia bacterium]
MYFIAVIIGLALGIIAWFVASYLVARLLIRIEERRPQLAGSRSIRAIEIGICGAVFVACLILWFWVARILWLQMHH